MYSIWIIKSSYFVKKTLIGSLSNYKWDMWERDSVIWLFRYDRKKSEPLVVSWSNVIPCRSRRNRSSFHFLNLRRHRPEPLPNRTYLFGGGPLGHQSSMLSVPPNFLPHPEINIHVAAILELNKKRRCVLWRGNRKVSNFFSFFPFLLPPDERPLIFCIIIN